MTAGLIDLDAAAEEILRRVHGWSAAGLVVGPVTWRDQGDGWPPRLKTDRLQVVEPDSIGVRWSRGHQQAAVALFTGGWADIEYWDGLPESEARLEVADVPTPASFGELLDRVIGYFGADR